MSRQFTEVGGGQQNPTWQIQATEKNGFHFDPNGQNEVQGYFSGEREIPGKDGKSFVVVTITLMNPDGTIGTDVDIIADTVLKDRLSKIPMNSYVCLRYQGRTIKKGYPAGPWSQTNSYHNWYVAYDAGATPLHVLTGRPAPTQGAPAQTFQAPPPQQTAPQFNPQQVFQAPPVQGQPTFQAPPVQQNNFQAPPAQTFQAPPVFTPPAQTAPPVFQGGNAMPPAQTFQAPPVQQMAPPAGQTWTPPPAGNVFQAPPVQQNNFQAPPAQQTFQAPPVQGQGMGQPNPGNVFGGPTQGQDDLPF